LDVSVQANIINLLGELKREYNTSYLFITHDLSLVPYVCDRMYVMYLGKIIEAGTVDQILEDPHHPYTEALINSIPRLELGDKGELYTLEGEVPSARSPPDGCNFHTRCPYARTICQKENPDLINIDDQGASACFRVFDDHEYWNSENL